MRITTTETTELRELDAHLRTGGLAIVPTDTVYGIVGEWGVAGVAEKIYELKRRPAEKRLIALVPDLAAVEPWAAVTPAARQLAEQFWPGALTLVLATFTGTTQGFRVPNHPWLLAWLQRRGRPLLSTSANPSGAPPATTLAMARDYFSGVEQVWFVDGGACGGEIPSTVVDASATPQLILRPGPLAGAVKEWLGITRPDE